MSPNWLEGITKLLQLTPRILFAISLAGSLILFLPGAIVGPLGLSGFRDAHRPWLGLATVTALALWSSHGLALIAISFRRRWRRRRAEARARSHLDTLSDEELRLLAYFVFHGAPTQLLPLNFAPARALCSKGLLQVMAGAGNMFSWPYTIPGHVWLELQLRLPELFPAIDTPEATDFFEHKYPRYMRDFHLYGRS